MLSSYETGRQHPAVLTLIKILSVLNADLRDLQIAMDSAAGGVPAVQISKPSLEVLPRPAGPDEELAQALGVLVRFLRQPPQPEPATPSQTLPVLGVIGRP